MGGKMSQSAFKQLQFSFRNRLALPSEYIIFRRIATLSEVIQVKYDCCPNSCIAYTGKYSILPSCPFCKESRLNARGKPHQQFTYFPLIPHLQGFFQSVEMMDLLRYRARFTQNSGTITNVFDGIHYQNLLKEFVMIDRKKLSHRYFSDPHDLALGLCTDSYMLSKRRRCGPVATPIVLQNYNVPPECHVHLKYLICIGVIPGPHQPKDLTSFLSPLDDEAAQLAYGIPTFDAATQTMFDLHAYIILKLGDIIAIQKFLSIKGVNGLFPCQSCKIKAVRGPGKTHYPALHPPRDREPSDGTIWKAKMLPMRRHEDFYITVNEIKHAPSKAAKDKIAKETGIRDLPALQRVQSIDYAHSIPWEWCCG